MDTDKFKNDLMIGETVAAYLRERFGKGYTACSLLADAPTLALPDKSYTECSQSSPNGLLVECGDEIRISAEALFNRLSYSHIRELVRLDDDLQRTFYECGEGRTLLIRLM